MGILDAINTAGMLIIWMFVAYAMGKTCVMHIIKYNYITALLAGAAAVLFGGGLIGFIAAIFLGKGILT